MTHTDEDAIRQVIEKAYIEGVHTTQDAATIRSGFHPEFLMLVLKDNAVEKVTVDNWLERVHRLKAANPGLWSDPTRCEYRALEIAGYTAMVELDVYKGDVHFSTDFMLLYRFADGWRIVSKTFSVPG